ncbi:DUF2220 family protein [Modestobacter sp. VKM Ac-2979]|uniref:Wadjet anti-phage system protein JetD domain-containing protein n=1 Tax=unclassified Modestobacter TaxID=2643866 RepID=UPI0022AB93B4|nr:MULTISPECIES: DUF3322 and DUF2220 domain-containing protein [unclassified Modestobacter]MCZ2813712.1 DUF2220 family protein [Modestobacter sp. VKM Ac-2979]MCZ2844313.1 DUF2220 family protein [Modestobacter sp. VKM Ac-2980]
MKTPQRILTELERRLDATWHQTIANASDGWPLRLPLSKPSTADMTTRFPEVQRWAIDWRTWAAERSLTLDWGNRLSSGTRQPVPTHVTVPDIDTAATLLGAPWPDRLHRGRDHWMVLRDRFPHAATPERLRAVDPLNDVDFGLLCTAAAWFATNDATGRTPRQVPIEGLHGKWLNRYRGLVTALAGKDSLGLVDRPSRVHITYLDPEHCAAGGRKHDSITLGDPMAPPYLPSIAVITENKDTAVYFPPLSGAIAIEGNGDAAPARLPRIPWLATVPRLIYWGDIDADGYEIVDALRRNGLPLTTILMDQDAYTAYERYGAWTDDRGNPIPCAPRKNLPNLTSAERAVYEALTDPAWTRTRRIEQERIPLEVARAHLAAPAVA